MRKLTLIVLAAIALFQLASAAVAEQWVEYRPADGAYRVEFPGQPTEHEEATEHGNAMRVAIYSSAANSTYAVAAGAVRPDLLPRPDNELLDAVRDGLVNGSKGSVRDERSLTVSGITARRFTLGLPDSTTGHWQIMVKGGHLYQVFLDVKAGQEDKAATDHFLDSFRFLDK